MCTYGSCKYTEDTHIRKLRIYERYADIRRDTYTHICITTVYAHIFHTYTPLLYMCIFHICTASIYVHIFCICENMIYAYILYMCISFIYV